MHTTYRVNDEVHGRNDEHKKGNNEAFLFHCILSNCLHLSLKMFHQCMTDITL